MGLIVPQTADISAPRGDGAVQFDFENRPTVWQLAAPRYEISFTLNYSAKGEAANRDEPSFIVPTPSTREHWKLGIVQNVLFYRVRVLYSGAALIQSKWDRPMLDCTVEGARPFYALPQSVEYKLLQAIDLAGKPLISLMWNLAAHEFDYGPKGIEFPFGSRYMLEGKPPPPAPSPAPGGNSAGAEAAPEPILNPRLSLKLVDQPKIYLPWRVHRRPLMRADLIGVMRCWLYVLRPKAPQVLAVSQLFTLASWMSFSHPADGLFDPRLVVSDSAGLSGDFRKQLSSNILNLDDLYKANRLDSLKFLPPGKETKPQTTGRLANDVTGEWYSEQGFISPVIP